MRRDKKTGKFLKQRMIDKWIEIFDKFIKYMKDPNSYRV